MTNLAPFHAYPRGEDEVSGAAQLRCSAPSPVNPPSCSAMSATLGTLAILGRVGSGKSTFIGFLIAQAERFGAAVVLWDEVAA